MHALIERDLKDIANIKRHDVMQNLLEILAAWSSKFMDISAISSNLVLSRPTLQSYINSLEALYLIERLKPWLKTDYERVNKHDKLFMTDTGIMASLLRWKLVQDHIIVALNYRIKYGSKIIAISEPRLKRYYPTVSIFLYLIRCG